MIHQLGHKLLEQIEKFSGELCVSLGKVSSRFVQEMLYGLLHSGKVHLTAIARSLEEPISIHKTHDRLSRNLGNPSLERVLEKSLLNLGARLINKKSLIIIDPSEIVKPYAQKMEYLGRVRDGSEKELAKGYWLYPVIGLNKQSGTLIPLLNRLYSNIAPDFKSENTLLLDIAHEIYQATAGQGILVMDRGGDRDRLLNPWSQNPQTEFIIRQRGDRHLLYRNGPKFCNELAEKCRKPYSQTITRIDRNGKEKTYKLKFGYIPVRLPSYPNRQLYLVVASGFGKKPIMLLTTLPMRRNKKVVWDIVESYIARWRIEETIRYIKQSYQLEDVRLHTYQRLKNLITIVMAASFFNCVYMTGKVRLKIMVGHVLKAAKRLFGIPDFNYYSMADGIQYVLTRTAPKMRKKKPHIYITKQRALFPI